MSRSQQIFLTLFLFEIIIVIIADIDTVQWLLKENTVGFRL